MDNDFATGYALGSDSNGGNCNNGFGGGAWEGIWGIIILAMVFGWGRGGFGGDPVCAARHSILLLTKFEASSHATTARMMTSITKPATSWRKLL